MRLGSSQRLSWWAYAIVFAVALAGTVRRNDFSPVVHPDTVFEEAIVQQCVRGDGCTTLGGSASFPGIFHMVGWLNFMALAEWLGLGRDAIHLAVQFANAARIVLLMFVAERLGGAPAAALAPYFAFQTGAAPGALYDTSLMAFFGTVLLVQCVAIAAVRPPLTLIVLAALGAAVVAEVHLAGGMALLSVLWVVVLHPSHRLRRAAVVTTAFTVAVLLVSPMTIAWDLDQLLARVSAASSGSASGQPDIALLPRLQMAAAAFSFTIPLILHRLGRSWLGEPPRGVQGGLAVCVPVTLAYAIGVAIGALPPSSYHYLEHAWPARAVVLAVPLAAIGAKVWEPAASLLAVPANFRRVALWTIPLLLSLRAAWSQSPPPRPQPHWADVQALSRLLHDDWRWDWPTVERGLRSPERPLLLNDLSVAIPGWQSEPGGAQRRPDAVTILAVDTRDVPDPLPPGWILVSPRTLNSLLAIPTPSSLQWEDQTACFEDQHGQETCFGPPVDPKLLWNLQSRVLDIRRFTRRVPWRGTAGTVEVISMPDLSLSCMGRIVHGPPGTAIDGAGRSARVTTPGEVLFEWRPNTSECGIWDFLKQGDPPFVLTGPPEAVAFLQRIVDRKEP